MIRVFAAYPIEKDLAKRFLQVSLKNSLVKNIRWTPEENLHITLFFIGEIDESNLEPIKAASKETFEGIKVFSLQFEDVVVKGKKNHSMVWGLFRKEKAFSELSEKIYVQVKPMMTISRVHEDPLPHCTLARIKGEFNRDEMDLSADIEKETFVTIDHAELWKTIQTKAGVRYERLEKYIFR
jgi:2'-5' RNA ligase